MYVLTETPQEASSKLCSHDFLSNLPLIPKILPSLSPVKKSLLLKFASEKTELHGLIPINYMDLSSKPPTSMSPFTSTFQF